MEIIKDIAATQEVEWATVLRILDILIKDDISLSVNWLCGKSPFTDVKI